MVCLGDLTTLPFSLSVLHRLDRFFCHGFFLLLCSEIARTLERGTPKHFCGGFGSAGHIGKLHSTGTPPSLVYGINLTPLVGRKSMDAAFAKKKHTTFKTNILSPSHAKKYVKFFKSILGIFSWGFVFCLPIA
jgi:hypothetical protein